MLMKNTIIFSTVVIFALLAVIWLSFTEMSDRDRLKQVEIDHLKKEIVEQRDSLESVLKVTQDSLEISYATIRQASIERQAAHERTQRIIKNYEKIIYISYTSDSARHRKLSELYPSYVIP